jgi:hypothetical protein
LVDDAIRWSHASPIARLGIQPRTQTSLRSSAHRRSARNVGTTRASSGEV